MVPVSGCEKDYSGSGVELCVPRQVLIDLCLGFQRPFCADFPLHFFPQLRIIIFFSINNFWWWIFSHTQNRIFLAMVQVSNTKIVELIHFCLFQFSPEFFSFLICTLQAWFWNVSFDFSVFISLRVLKTFFCLPLNGVCYKPFIGFWPEWAHVFYEFMPPP